MKVYWTPGSEPHVPEYRHLEPKPAVGYLFNKITDNTNKQAQLKLCPAVRSWHDNVYSLSFPISYNLKLEDNNIIRSEMYDQEFWDSIVIIRSWIDKLISLRIGYLFITEEPCETEFFHAHNTDNDFVNKTILIPGKWDISKWFRNTDCAFLVKDGVTEININEGDPYTFVRFKTDEPIEFVKFEYTTELRRFIDNQMHSKSYRPNKFYPLNWYYDILNRSRYRNKIINEVKKNIL